MGHHGLCERLVCIPLIVPCAEVLVKVSPVSQRVFMFFCYKSNIIHMDMLCMTTTEHSDTVRYLFKYQCRSFCKNVTILLSHVCTVAWNGH